MSAVQPEPVRDVVILAAGNGDRFKNTDHESKLLHPLLGQPIILRTVETVVAAGMTRLHLVLGYQGSRIRDLIDANAPPGVAIDFAYNEQWHLENGVSAALAQPLCGDRRFALVMGDHLYDPAMLRRLARRPLAAGDSVLAVDARPVDPAFADEATKVRLDGDRIVAIGKGLTTWDALDTGVFVFAPALFDALAGAQAKGETTLRAGVQRLADAGSMRAAAVAEGPWCDVDTLDDLTTAETLFAVETERA